MAKISYYKAFVFVNDLRCPSPPPPRPRNKVAANRTQSPQALWPAISRQERLWGHRILLPQDFCGKTMETVTEQPIKKFKFFRCRQSLPGVAPLTKKPEDSGHEIGLRLVWWGHRRPKLKIREPC